PHRLRGIWFALLGALGQALGLVLGRYGAPEYDAFAATQIRVLTGMVGFAVVFSVLRRWPRIFAAVRDGRAMRHVARGAFFGPFLGVSLGLFAAQRAGTGVAATIIATVPVLLIPVTVIGFGERITPRELAGALLAVGGVALLFLG
ncbi:MAG: EamA family transporter, partial [Spirochaetaceae bacterium]